MKLISILSGKGFVMYNKELAHSVSVNGAIIFGQLCSSYESFERKGMLTIRDNKEYFFLTSETLEEETALTYKQQLKAAKELEGAGYIETKVMGVPSKKYFHITDKIVHELLGNLSSSKREDLKKPTNQELEGQNVAPRYDNRENLELPKGNTKPVQKGSTIKNKKKKEQYKDNNNNNLLINNTINKFRNHMMKSFENLYNEFASGRWSKIDYFKIANKFINEVIEDGRYLNIPEEKVEGYVYQSLKNISYKSDYKHGKIKFEPNQNSKVPLYNWLEDNDDELPY